jgi:hypothetical protein
MKDRIMDLHKKGKAPAEIVKALGVTKGVVAGVIRRFRHSNNLPPQDRATVAHVGKGNPKLPDDPKQCLWLGGKINKHEVCTCRRVPGKPYCERHMKIAYKEGTARNLKVPKEAGAGYA